MPLLPLRPSAIDASATFRTGRRCRSEGFAIRAAGAPWRIDTKRKSAISHGIGLEGFFEADGVRLFPPLAHTPRLSEPIHVTLSVRLFI